MMTFETEEKVMKFKAYKALFKTKSEHKITDAEYDMEIQLYHKSEDGNTAIVSFMLKADNKKEVEREDDRNNKLLDQLEPLSWRTKPEF
jgi:carbonic anhydrase